MKLAIAAGHSAVSPGAVRDEYREHDLCEDIRRELSGMLGQRGYDVIDPAVHTAEMRSPEYLDERIAVINQGDVDAALEIHLNASADPSVNYVLCLHAPGSLHGRELANAITDLLSDEIGETLGPKSARARPDTWTGRGGLRFLRGTRPPAVIVEPCFLSSERVRRMLDRERGAFALSGESAVAGGDGSRIDGFRGKSPERGAFALSGESAVAGGDGSRIDDFRGKSPAWTRMLARGICAGIEAYSDFQKKSLGVT
jgi:hypothetical protein